MNRSQDCLALTMKDAAKLVGVDYRTVKLRIENGTIPTVQLGPRRMIPLLSPSPLAERRLRRVHATPDVT